MNYPQVLYMELDCRDGIYKPHSISTANNDYTIGELFLTSKNDTPEKSYKIRAYHKEEIIYETLTLISENRDQSFDYTIVTDNSIFKNYPFVIFRAYKVNQQSNQNLNLWILFELRSTVSTLDELEENEDYNLIGDTGFEV